jgi:ribosome-associated protein
MQPNFRQYYNLEELWGEKPVRLKFGALKPVVKVPVKATPVKKAAAKPVDSLKRSNAAKKGVQETFPSKAQVRKALATKPAAKKTTTKVPAVKAPAKASVGVKPAAKKVAVKKPLARKT